MFEKFASRFELTLNLVRISAKATARFASKRPVSAEGREALEDNVFQPVGLVRNRPLLDAPLRAIL